MDLSEIRRYIATVLLESAAAKNVVDKISEAILSLDELPLRHALFADVRLASSGIRKIMIDNYIVFYLVNEEQKIVTIVRILYGSRRDWINLI